MAHVLLPCDLPSWPDVQRMLSQLRRVSDVRQLVRTMDHILDTCCVSLDPDDAQRPPQVDPHAGFVELGRFVEESLSPEERSRFLEDTLPALAARAADLKLLKPSEGLLYSLRKEGVSVHLERGFVSSLLANAFFSTFPKRNAKTHPTLQDFRMVDFFLHLSKRSHQKKLKAFLRYFEDLSSDPTGAVTFTRKVVSGPSLPGWLCSDRPLVPLVVRSEGSIKDADSQVYRACFCPPLIGGDVLKASTSKEAKLFFTFPELLVILSFVESLDEDEALIAEGTGQQGDAPAGFCFLDAAATEDNSTRQFEDRALLRELNKALAAFLYEPRQQEVSLELPSVSSRRSSGSGRRSPGSGKRRNPLLGRDKKSTSQTSSKLSMRTASQSSVPPVKEDDFYTADDDSEEGSRLSDSLPRTEEVSVSRSDSLGFVLGEESEDASLPRHERLDDFRKRIRKRTRRRLSRRSSSYAGSSGSSDMEDISEDPELVEGPPTRMRPANSEPSIVSILYDGAPLSEAAEIALRGGGRRIMVTASNGHLKAYSYDGVSPNLPVPFRARFRRRRGRSPSSSFEDSPCTGSAPSAEVRRLPVAVDSRECTGDCQLKVTVLWLAASMADLQSLVLYTAGQPQLLEVCAVYRKVLSREWTVGDLSCEVLRFCRNRLYPKRRSHSRLFGQLIGHTPDSLD